MRLSEAIRLGSMMHPQMFDEMCQYDDDARTNILATCALGAARVAGYALADAILTKFPTCPICGHDTENLFHTVSHLNDYHKWTREHIADWVATIEPAETTSADVSTSDVRGTTETAQPVLSIRG